MSPAALGRVALAFAALPALVVAGFDQGIVDTPPWTKLAIAAYLIGAPIAFVLGLLAGHRWRTQSPRTGFPWCGILATTVGGIATAVAIVVSLLPPIC